MNLGFNLSKRLKDYFQDEFLLAVSGGKDSVALFYGFLHLKKHFSLHFKVAHIHHGPSSNSEQQTYRWQAMQFVRSLCESNDIEFLSNFSESSEEIFLKSFSPPLSSEEDFRRYRHRCLQEIKNECGAKWLVFAHHQEDLLETRLIRMIRGVGPEGLVAMELESGNILRPLLLESCQDLQTYLLSRDAQWIEDPSNESLDPFRNWMRKEWLPHLESKRPGSLKSLSRSLDQVLRSTDLHPEIDSCLSEDGVNLSLFLSLHLEHKKQVLASYMRRQGLKNYGHSHVMELIKRLDNSQRSLTFTMLKREWQVDAGRLKVLGLGEIVAE
ncbi:MAG: tRNA lysidine(34) synthetase TilS [Bdellovibrionales bacterium]|nr:tRNA lysidine(34) synthetase TilS [Bdellovibrionales bacterium]